MIEYGSLLARDYGSIGGGGRATNLSAIGRYFSRRAFEAERYFTAIAASAPLNFLPRQYCGFECEIRKRATLRCVDSQDARAVVSLALLRQIRALSAYANKTPIMCINVNRFVYTVAAFEFVEQTEDPVSEALEFYVSEDVRQSDDLLTNSSTTDPMTPPNERFSDLLHRLRSTGYEAYVFSLAERLNFDVDLVKCHNDKSSPTKTLLRYRRIYPPTERNSHSTRIGVGTLTAVDHGDRWFVKITTSPLIP